MTVQLSIVLKYFSFQRKGFPDDKAVLAICIASSLAFAIVWYSCVKLFYSWMGKYLESLASVTIEMVKLVSWPSRASLCFQGWEGKCEAFLPHLGSHSGLHCKEMLVLWATGLKGNGDLPAQWVGSFYGSLVLIIILLNDFFSLNCFPANCMWHFPSSNEKYSETLVFMQHKRGKTLVALPLSLWRTWWVLKILFPSQVNNRRKLCKQVWDTLSHGIPLFKLL